MSKSLSKSAAPRISQSVTALTPHQQAMSAEPVNIFGGSAPNENDPTGRDDIKQGLQEMRELQNQQPKRGR